MWPPGCRDRCVWRHCRPLTQVEKSIGAICHPIGRLGSSERMAARQSKGERLSHKLPSLVQTYLTRLVQARHGSQVISARAMTASLVLEARNIV